MYFRYLVIISPWKRTGPSFEQIWIPFTQGYFVPSFVEIGPVRGFGEEDVNVESLRQRQTMTTTTGKFWSEKLTWAFGSGGLKTKQKRQYCQKPRDIWIRINLIKIGCKFCSLTSYTYIWGQICIQRKKCHQHPNNILIIYCMLLQIVSVWDSMPYQ